MDDVVPFVDGIAESPVHAKVNVSLTFGSLTTAVATTLPLPVSTRRPRRLPCAILTSTTGGALAETMDTVDCDIGPRFALVGPASAMTTFLPPPLPVVRKTICPRRPLLIDTLPLTRSWSAGAAAVPATVKFAVTGYVPALPFSTTSSRTVWFVLTVCDADSSISGTTVMICCAVPILPAGSDARYVMT